MTKKTTRARWLGRDVGMPAPRMTLCLSEREYFKALQDLGCSHIKDAWLGPNANASTHTLTKGGHVATIVCLQDDNRNPISTCAVLVHEAVHVWQAYTESIGEDKPSSEFEAYGIQSISERLMIEYARRIKRKPRRHVK